MKFTFRFVAAAVSAGAAVTALAEFRSLSDSPIALQLSTSFDPSAVDVEGWPCASIAAPGKSKANMEHSSTMYFIAERSVDWVNMPAWIVGSHIAPLSFAALTHRAGSTFARLSVAETVRVRYRSRGCFHDETYEFEFGGGPSVRVTVTMIPEMYDREQRRMIELARVPLGTIVLEPKELEALDRLIAFYRSEPAGGCTTQDEITISYVTTDQPTTFESYIDRSCQTQVEKPTTTFASLADRLRPRNK